MFSILNSLCATSATQKGDFSRNNSNLPYSSQIITHNLAHHHKLSKYDRLNPSNFYQNLKVKIKFQTSIMKIYLFKL